MLLESIAIEGLGRQSNREYPHTKYSPTLSWPAIV